MSWCVMGPEVIKEELQKKRFLWNKGDLHSLSEGGTFTSFPKCLYINTT